MTDVDSEMSWVEMDGDVEAEKSGGGPVVAVRVAMREEAWWDEEDTMFDGTFWRHSSEVDVVGGAVVMVKAEGVFCRMRHPGRPWSMNRDDNSGRKIGLRASDGPFVAVSIVSFWERNVLSGVSVASAAWSGAWAVPECLYW